MAALIFPGIWIVAIAAVWLIWSFAGKQFPRAKWIIRGAALAFFVRPALFGFYPMPLGFTLFGYSYDAFLSGQTDLIPEVVNVMIHFAESALVLCVMLHFGARLGNSIRTQRQRS